MIGLKGPSEVGKALDRGNKQDIRGFSRASRRNLIWTMGRVNRELAGLPLFQTLTYGRDWPPDGRVVKRHLDAFNKRRARRYPESSAIWKMELQKRGAPHFHLMVFGVPAQECRRAAVLEDNGPEFRQSDLRRAMHVCDCPVCWTQGNWWDIAGYGSFDHLRAGTRVERARTWAGVVSYTAKYLGKLCDNKVTVRDTGEVVELRDCGRWWGVSGRRFLPVDLVTYRLTPQGFYELRRYARRIVQSSGQKKRDRGRGNRGLACWVGRRTLEQFRRLRH